MRLDPRRTPPIVVNQFHDMCIIGPLTAMQSSCSETCDNTSAAGPEPPSLCAKFRIDVNITQRIDVWEQSAASRSQLGLGQSPCGDRLAADERFSHDGSVAGCAPTVTSAVHTSTDVRQTAHSHTTVRLAAHSAPDQLAQDQTGRRNAGACGDQHVLDIRYRVDRGTAQLADSFGDAVHTVDVSLTELPAVSVDR